MTMTLTTHHARILGPVAYRAGSGRKHNIPMGPCIVEIFNGQCADIIWGSRGQRSAAMPVAELDAAQDHGNLLLLD